MSRWLALAEGSEENTDTLPDNPTKPYKTPRKHPQVAFCRVMSGCRVEAREYVGGGEWSLRGDNQGTACSTSVENPDIDTFEERGAFSLTST